MIDVLYLHNSSLISGGERSLLQLWANLDRSVYRPHVLLPQEGIFAQEVRRMGIEVEFLAVAPLRPWAVGQALSDARALSDILARRHIRLVHSYAPRNNLLASWVAHRIRVPVVWHERNLLWHGERDISRIFAAMADGIICNSQAVAERFRADRGIPEKVRVIHNGVDHQAFMPSVNRNMAKERLGWGGRKVIGAITNLEPRKGVEMFLDVAARIADQRRDVLFVVMGGCYGSDERRLEKLQGVARGLGLDDLIVWTGFQSDIRPYLSAFDVLVHVTEKEACSRAILESMAMRVPVVAFGDGGNPELIVDGVTGVLVESSRADIMVERLAPLLDRDVELARMGQAARLRVQEMFDVRVNAQRTQSFYAELLKGRP